MKRFLLSLALALLGFSLLPAQELVPGMVLIVNGQTINSPIYRNPNTPPLAETSHLSDFVDLEIVFKSLGASVDLEPQRIRIYGPKVPAIELRLGTELLAHIYNDQKFTGSYRDFGSIKKYYIKIANRHFIAISQVRYLINGSLKEDAMAVQLFSSDFVRTDIPASLEECYALLDNVLAPSERLKLKSRREADLITYHFSLGLWIRNTWVNPGADRIGKAFIENGINHTDDISMLIIKGYYWYLQGKPKTFQELIKK